MHTVVPLCIWACIWVCSCHVSAATEVLLCCAFNRFVVRYVRCVRCVLCVSCRGGEASMDISADLTELGKTPVAVVCAGAKSVSIHSAAAPS